MLLTAGASVVGAASLSLQDSIRAFLPAATAADAGDFARIVILQLRLPRILMAVLAGLALGIAGAIMQGVLRNPLVSPYTLGLSAGASCGAAIAIVLGAGVLAAGPYLLITNAFIFGLATLLLVLGISRLRGTSIETIILAGVALGYLFSAIISALKYTSGNDQLREIVMWLMGDLSGANWQTLIILTPIVVLFSLFAMRYAWDLNIMGAGDEVSTSLGVNVGRTRIIILIVAAVLTSSIVAFTGIIGFIGLVSPHICRLIAGNDHRYLIPASGMMGALFLVCADTACRTIMGPTELPVGIITAVIGVPFFLFLLIRKKRRWWQ